MKKIVKKLTRILLAILITISLAFTITDKPTHADAGYHSNYSGGSSSSSSSHSYSGGSSSSRSRRSSSSRRSSYSSSSNNSDRGDALAGFIIWLVIIIIILIIIKRNENKRPSQSRSLQSNAMAVAMLKELVPQFDEKAFLQDGYKIFLDIENAWMNFEMEKVRNVITDEMFNMYESQLSSMEIKGEQNIMKDFVLKDCAITSCVKQNDNIEVTTKYIIEFYDYIINKETKKVLRGSSSRKLRMYYDLTFIMSASQQKIDKCPNCGAPVDVNSAGICPYCHSKIIGENTTWVMSKKVCTNQINL